jgi:hypothetical protein
MTKETEVEATAPVAQASRDEEQTEIVETVELAPPEKEVDTRDYEDVINDDDDPRAAIYARHNERREDEIDESLETHGENNLENKGSPDIIEEDQAATPRDAAEMVEIKILGDVRQVSKKKIDAAGGIENYQIRIAAQEQMERNAHERTALAERQEALDAQERRIAEATPAIPATDSQVTAPPDGSTPTDDQNLEELARQHQEAVYDGDENAPSILVKLSKAAAKQAAGQGKAFDEVAFRTQVKDELIEDQRKAATVKATQSLIKDNPELNQRDKKFDPRLFTAVDDETSVVRRQHPDWEPEKQMQEAFDRVQKWKGKPEATTLSDKQDAKRGMKRPRSGTQRHTPPPPAPAPSRSDYVAEQRKLRGQES